MSNLSKLPSPRAEISKPVDPQSRGTPLTDMLGGVLGRLGASAREAEEAHAQAQIRVERADQFQFLIDELDSEASISANRGMMYGVVSFCLSVIVGGAIVYAFTAPEET
jgi:hypothetical protein